MKVGSKLVFLFRDSEGFSTAISDSLHPNPTNPSSLTLLEESFELSLEPYGIKDVKASGTLLHFVDHQGFYQVSFLLMQNYEPPVLVCAVNEVLGEIAREESSSLPTILVPFIVASSKLKRDGRSWTKSENKVPIYGVQIGPETDTTKAVAARTEKLSGSFQVHHEPLACLLQLARVLHLPTFILIGERGQRVSDKNIEDLEILHEIGEILASTLNLSFSKDRMKWKPKVTSKNSVEPWRALYG
ncbi:period circadian protein [Trema orientale]|uniref:Period circadian protein n=1 Tax=Trema orientale TaxID=63057 RepID=A0A2P5ER06_TREOI|nr:period circadian protein [Trema orientale]